MRFLPRFSLRFVWITLTIFLIVFGFVASYWKAYQEHEAIATRLLAVNFGVEEEPLTFAGLRLGKTMTGLEYPSNDYEIVYLKLFDEIPHPREMRRFSLTKPIYNQDSLNRFLNSLQRFEYLEELYLNDQVFTEPQILQLGTLRELRVLDLSDCQLPAGSLTFLERLPRLEVLNLHSAYCDASQFVNLNLPKLRLIDLRKTALTELPLTKQGWGRFLKLETIILGETRLSQVACEPGAMPTLKFLDLAAQDSACDVEWAKLPAAAPNLTGLAVHTSQLTPQLISAIRRMPHLRYLQLNNQPFPGVPYQDHLKTLLSAQHPAFFGNRYGDPFGPYSRPNEVSIDKTAESLAREIVEQCPKLLFCHDLDAFLGLIVPREGSNSRPWNSTNWRQEPGFGGQGNGGGGFF